MLNVVILNGGRGAASLIPALLARQGLHVTSVVNAYDDGKSTGEIRRIFGMLGPSDIRKVQELMLPQDDPDYDANMHLFRYRFPPHCELAEVLAHLRRFAQGDQADLVGATLTSAKSHSALQSFVREFVTGLGAIERVSGERFSFADCSIMNCIYAGAFLIFNRNIERATLYIDRLFKLRGTVLPTSIEDKKLVALRENGQMLYSEAEIVELRSNVRVERVYLLDKLLDKSRFETLSTADKRYYLERHHCYVGVSPGVRAALQQADIIIYSAGTQHSSLYPTYMSAGLAQTIADNHTAYKAFVTNIGADYETPSYKASDYIRGAYRYLNLSDEHSYAMVQLFDVVLVNQSRLKADETYVEYDEDGFGDIAVPRVVDAFESPESPGKHDGAKVVRTILGLYEEASALVGST
ncbi:MAG: YvcK family protein [Burkholderiales bacterium]|nr:YvcK family protein [Burkholderiales bacterium]